jgi:hypothetical protein
MTPQLSPNFIFADIGGLLLMPIFFLGFAFWAWMLVDCANREKEGSARLAWLLIVLFANVVGAPLYFFLRKMPRQRRAQYQTPRELYQPWRQR